MLKILCTKNNNFSAKYDRKTSSCPITSACKITKPQVYLLKSIRIYLNYGIHTKINMKFCLF